MAVPTYYEEQLKAEPPTDCHVPGCAIPALIEGDVDTASIATIGINPRGIWSRCDYSPLREFEIDEEGRNALWEDKRRYFEKRPYRRYFDPLEGILNKCDASYGGVYGSEHRYTAVSMDVVQWPTQPSWGEVPDCQDELIEKSKDLFKGLLTANPGIKILLGNGLQVKKALARMGFARTAKVRYCDGYKLFCGEIEDKQFIGWSAFMSRSRLNKDQKADLAKQVGELASSVLHA